MARKKRTASTQSSDSTGASHPRARNLLEPIPQNELELFDTGLLMAEIERRCMGAVLVTMEQARSTKRGEKPGFYTIVRSSQNHGAIAVMLQCAINVNAHQFAVDLAEKEPQSV